MFPFSNLNVLGLRIEKVVQEELRDINSIGLNTEFFNHATKGFEIDLAAFSIEEDEKEFTLPRNLLSQEENSKVYRHLIDANELEKIFSKSSYHNFSIATTALILLSSGIQFHLLSVVKNLRRSHKLRTRLPDLKYEGSSVQKLDKINDYAIKVIKRLPAESKSSVMQQSKVKLKVDRGNFQKLQVSVVYGPDIAGRLQNEGLSQDLWNKSSLFPQEITTQDVLHAIEALGNSMFIDKVLQKFCLTKRLQIQSVN